MDISYFETLETLSVKPDLTEDEVRKLKVVSRKALDELLSNKFRSECDNLIVDIFSKMSEQEITASFIEDTLKTITRQVGGSGALLFDKNNQIVYSSLNNDCAAFAQFFDISDFTRVQEFIKNNLVVNKPVKTEDKVLNKYADIGIKKITFLPINDKNIKYMILLNSKLNEKYVRAFNEKLIKLYKAIAVRMKNEKEMREKSEIDKLTGLLNSNAYQDFVRTIYDRECDSMGLILGDLFRLKYVNDNMGHGYGDEYIRYVATILQSSFEPDDKIYRIGGDEFVIIVNGKSEEYIIEKITLIKEYVSDQPIYGPNDEPIDAEISFGFAMHNGGLVNYNKLLNDADDLLKCDKTALYVDKNVDRRK